MRDHVSQGIELSKSKSKIMILTRLPRISPVLFALRLATALYFAMALMLSSCLFLPARAEGDDNETATKLTQKLESRQTVINKTNSEGSGCRNPCSDPARLTNKDKWSVAKTNVDKFFELNGSAIGNLFGYPFLDNSLVTIHLDEKVDLKVLKSRGRNEFCFLPTRKIPPGYLVTGPYDGGFEWPKVPSEAIWTGAKRKDEKEYWSIIKANLDKFIGMSGDEIVALLGPERQSSKPWSYVQYRVGDAGLTFYLKDGKAQKFKFKSDVYIPGT